MSFHYQQRVEVWIGAHANDWRPGKVNIQGDDGKLRIVMDSGQVEWAMPFYIRPLEES